MTTGDTNKEILRADLAAFTDDFHLIGRGARSVGATNGCSGHEGGEHLQRLDAQAFRGVTGGISARHEQTGNAVGTENRAGEFTQAKAETASLGRSEIKHRRAATGMQDRGAAFA